MGSPLPRGPCCSRLPKATPTQPASQSLALCSQGRPGTATHRPRRVVISAFLFNPAAKSNNSSSSGNRSRESITNRLSELRIRSEDEELARLSQQRAEREEEADRRAAESSSGALADESGPGPRVGRGMGPWPAATSDDEEGDGFDQGMAFAGASSGGPVTPRSLRYMITDPKPEIKLLHRFKPGQGPRDSEFWRSFLDKCRLAWGVFFPPAPHSVRRQSRLSKWAGGIGKLLAPGPAAASGGAGAGGGDGAAASGLSAKQVVLSRLQMVLIADRCGVSPEHLLEMKAQTLTALAEYMGKDLEEDVSQLEVQVSALKPNGERITMTIGFADMLGDEQLRDPIQYHYEYEDDDDYFLPEEDDGRVADIAEAPAAGLKAARVAAQPIAGGASAGEAA